MNDWLISQSWVFWLLVLLAPLYVAWIFYMVFYNIGYARNRGNFMANIANEKDFLIWEAKKRQMGKSLHGRHCQHHPDNQEQEGPPSFVP